MTRDVKASAPSQDWDDFDHELASTASMEGRKRRLYEWLEPMLVGDSLEWIWKLGERLQHAELTVPATRSLVFDLAWRARTLGQRAPDEREWERVAALPHGHAVRLALAAVHGQRYRFDFKFARLESWSRRWVEEFPDDALIVALASFAALGRGSSEGLHLFRRSIASPNADRVSRYVCLQGLWFAHWMDGQAEEILDLSDDIIRRGEAGGSVYYWRSSALRKLGRFEQAREEIDRAIDMLPEREHEIHQDYARERELVTTSWMLHQHSEQLSSSLREELSQTLHEQVEVASAALSRQVESAQKAISDSLLKIVEILGLFVALVGFLLGSGAVVLRADTFKERLAAMGLALAGSLAFFVLLRLVVGFRGKR